MNQLTIVMYHYVRPIAKSKYPRLKGLELEGFKRQLDFFSLKYTFITSEQLIAYALGNEELPTNSCYLTFDDGFKDHIEYVLPELLSRGIQGSFFPPADAILYREMLDVHSIHFLLEATTDYLSLVKELDTAYLDLGGKAESLETLRSAWLIPSRYDTADVAYVKHMLQHALPLDARSQIVTELFRKHVGRTQADFADELYISESETKKMIEHGMYVGSHGARHLWLGRESKASQVLEIESGLDFLSKVGANTKEWIMCYPYGSYNQDTLSLLAEKNCLIGLTTTPALASLDHSKMLELNRFDTNDFPQ